MDQHEEKTRPPPCPHPEWLFSGEWQSVPRDLQIVRMFIEAVMHDDASFEAGLWQGKLPKQAIAAIDRVIEKLRPVPMTERPPGEDTARETDTFLVWHDDQWRQAAWTGTRWMFCDMHGWDGSHPEDQYATADEVSHWLPLPPKPE